MYDVLLIAQYVIRHCIDNGIFISNLKLQKILYFIQAEFLVDSDGRRLCFSEAIEAWNFGPVVPEVYHEYKIYGSANIPGTRGAFGMIQPHDRELIDAIVDECAQYSASKLVEITHHQRPWIEAFSNGRSSEILPQKIYSYFAEA